ncbi:MAG: hypothetical protein EAZ27_13070 [Cytophagales bacterium]|nr:MAG: hypothetical protein EAZ27_13070 [Cytophagales bacterium]
MTLSEIKGLLPQLDNVIFKLDNGYCVPDHFHITEVGIITKHFIDCGGSVRYEKVANFQLWDANDFEHRLKPIKLLNIIKLSEEKLAMEDLQIEVEFQAQTIGKYDLDFNGSNFILVSKQTACLATDSCGITKEKLKVNLEEVLTQNSCKPGGGCC